MAKDYHKILGISDDAGQEEIKSAYRRLAKEHHPDQTGGDSDRFRDIQEAYSVLVDFGKRHVPENDRPDPWVRVYPSQQPKPYEPEPLIPEQEPRHAYRKRKGEPLKSEDPGEDLYDWIYRYFF
jgi:curved DNA-binding protein CbpA